MKRAFDFLTAFFLLVILALPLLILALMIRIRLGSPVFFIQTRPGFKSQPFKMVKFRTMTNKHDLNGALLSDADRLTPFGCFLRSNSLDELPELWNVLRGDMSLVGPRPLLMEYLPLYSIDEARRHEVRPGITGWAQVNGRNAISWEDKFKLDIWYVDNQSIILDAKILILTLKKVFIREGINATGYATMPIFRGQKQNKIENEY